MAYNAGGSSTWTNVVEEQAILRSADSLATDVSKPGKVTLTWGRNNGVDNFNIYRFTGADSSPATNGTLVGTAAGSVMKFVDTGFPTYEGQVYTYQIIPVGGRGAGPASSTVTAIPTEPAW